MNLARRDFLKLSAASAALATAGCSQPREPIVPYAAQPEITLPGVPRFYATAASFVGAAEGMLVESNTGRPTKVEGNPAHPGSLGATSIHGQASVLQLWDPERSKAPRRHGQPATRGEFERELADGLAKLDGGQGLHLLLRDASSPTLLRQLELLRQRFPRCSIHHWDPLARSQAIEPLYRLEEAGAILSLDSRFLDDHPNRLSYARQYARARARSCRLYALESTPSRNARCSIWPPPDPRGWLGVGGRPGRARGLGPGRELAS